MQKGFIFPSLYIYLGLGAVIVFLGLAVKVQSSRLETCKLEHQAFVNEVQRLAKEQELTNKVKKLKADDELKKLKSVNNDLSKRVRDNANTSFVQPSTTTGKPDLACFQTEALDGAIRNFAKRVSGIIEQGQSAVTDLDNAKVWANP